MSKRQPLTPADEQLLIDLLDRVGTPMPAGVFNALAAKVPLTGIEAVILRRSDRQLKVLLLQRPKNDKHWPEQWHMPGTILRNSDAPEPLNIEGSFSAAFRRIEDRELKAKFLSLPKFAGYYFHRAERGVVNSILFCCEAAEGAQGTYFPVDALPENFIECHRPMIAQAVKEYERTEHP